MQLSSLRLDGLCCAVAVMAVLVAPIFPAGAGVNDSRFVVSADGRSVNFDVKSMPRREVLTRLFGPKSVEFKWLSPAAENELVSGTFSGSPGKVAYQLLSSTDFVVVYNRSGASPRISRIVVLGPSPGQSSGNARAAIEAALPTVLPAAAAQFHHGNPPSIQAPVMSPAPINVELPLKPVSGVDGATFFTPAPPGMPAPYIVPPPGGETAPPLTPSSGGDPPSLTPAPR